MIEPFCSVYRRDYRRLFQDDFPEKPKPCSLFDPKENFLPEKDSKLIYNPDRDDQLIKRLIKNRMQSTYQVSYRPPASRKSDSTDPFSDEFMIYFNKLFEEKRQPVLKPPETYRRLHGIKRFELFYTPLSTYQDEISREAYKIFKKDFDQGISRLFGKKQKEELKRQKEEERLKNKPEGKSVEGQSLSTVVSMMDKNGSEDGDASEAETEISGKTLDKSRNIQMEEHKSEVEKLRSEAKGMQSAKSSTHKPVQKSEDKAVQSCKVDKVCYLCQTEYEAPFVESVPAGKKH